MRENVDTVRASYEALSRGDFARALEVVDPQIEIHDHDVPEAGEYRGLEGLAEWQRNWEREFESWRWEPEEFVEVADRVVAVLRTFSTGRRSGVAVNRVDAAVWTMRDGRCVRLDYYGSKEEALEAVGLSA
jgi:ketosteroid isomerase-like protein